MDSVSIGFDPRKLYARGAPLVPVHTTVCRNPAWILEHLRLPACNNAGVPDGHSAGFTWLRDAGEL